MTELLVFLSGGLTVMALIAGWVAPVLLLDWDFMWLLLYPIGLFLFCAGGAAALGAVKW